MTWHYPDNGDKDEPFVIEGTSATILYYAAIWFLVTGIWKTLEVLSFLGKLIKWP
jgi:hypothetical protein